MTVSECVWADWRGLIECEINKVSHSALQRPLNDPYEEDHQCFDGFVPGMKVLSASGLSLSISVSSFLVCLSVCLSSKLLFLFASVCLSVVHVRLSRLSVYLFICCSFCLSAVHSSAYLQLSGIFSWAIVFLTWCHKFVKKEKKKKDQCPITCSQPVSLSERPG